MADVLHLRCHRCAGNLVDPRYPYCSSCNLQLCYRALPILLGLLLTGRPGLPAALARDRHGNIRRAPYSHSRYIMD